MDLFIAKSFHAFPPEAVVGHHHAIILLCRRAESHALSHCKLMMTASVAVSRWEFESHIAMLHDSLARTPFNTTRTPFNTTRTHAL
jgi:hypothetical protein